MCRVYSACKTSQVLYVSLYLMEDVFFFFKVGIKEKPVVFHSKVKSSGYTTTPRYGKASPFYGYIKLHI